MSPEDLKQIRAVVREEIQDNNQVLLDEVRVGNQALAATLREEMHAGDQALREEMRALDQALREGMHASNEALAATLREEFSERLGAAVVAIGDEFSQLRQELSRRMDTLENRMYRIAETNAALATEVGAPNRWATRVEKDYTDLSNTQFAQQRAIDELVKRWNPPPPSAPPSPPQT